jgi:glycosyltransferase involved in cell wall biosynthesis
MTTQPLVSCICVTQNRRMYLRQAISYWKRARLLYPNTELVILDGSPAPNPWFDERKRDELDTWRILYHHIPAEVHNRTGWFHNQACERAHGDIILQWDDDDWHSPARIVSQVAAICGSREPDNTFAFTSRFYWYDIRQKRASLSRTWDLPGDGSLGAMFAYHRKVWEKVPFRDVPQGEDSHFWSDTRQAGVGFLDMRDPTYCIYMRHNQNGSHDTSLAWNDDATSVARSYLGLDLEWYDELAEILPTNAWLQNDRHQYGIYGAMWPHRR